MGKGRLLNENSDSLFEHFFIGKASSVVCEVFKCTRCHSGILLGGGPRKISFLS